MALRLLVHGGAGPLGADDAALASMEACLAAARRGFAVLRRGGSAVDAVEAAVVALEDDPLFNAGKGATLTSEGTVELDAALMDGADLRAGAVGALVGFPNPVRVARRVMERSPHVLLVGDGAARFASAQGLPSCPPESLVTARARARWERERERRAQPLEGGTVGAVACDGAGHVAAATSTGGMLFKLPGRVGDSPLIGGGTFADDLGGAVSATGHGEAILRVALAHTVSQLIRAGRTPQAATDEALVELARVGGQAGLIVVDRQGRMGVAFNTERMARAWVSQAEEGSAFA